MKNRTPLSNPSAGRPGEYAGVSARRHWAVFVTSAGVVALMAVAMGISQQVPQTNNGLPGPGRTSQGFPALPESANPHPDSNRALEDLMKGQDTLKRNHALNEIRHKEMASDTAKLVILANALKREMEKDPNNPLNWDEVRKVEEIAKLAHGVQEKMRASIGN